MAAIVGADSVQPVTQDLIAKATTVFGTTPQFWGRYFTISTTGGSGEYHHAREGGLLADAGIRVLPIARQTKNVGPLGPTDDRNFRALGLADGMANARDVIATFAAQYLVDQGADFYIFLDVEGDGFAAITLPGLLHWLGRGPSTRSCRLGHQPSARRVLPAG